MPKMTLQEDGTVLFPIKGGKVLTLDEPSLAELAWMHDETAKIDAELTQLPGLVPQTATAEQVAAFDTASQTRTQEIYGTGREQPYGKLIVQVLAKLAMADDGSPIGLETLTIDKLYGWAASPRVMRELLEHYRTPLPGKASRQSQ